MDRYIDCYIGADGTGRHLIVLEFDEVREHIGCSECGGSNHPLRVSIPIGDVENMLLEIKDAIARVNLKPILTER